MEQIARDPRADFLAVYNRSIGRNGKAALCKPCAVALADRGKTVKPAAMRCEKITCIKPLSW